MDEESIGLLEELTQAAGIPGHETEVQAIFQSRLAEIGPINRDRLGSIFCTKQGDASGPRILLDSHLDEVGFIVQRVTDAGYVKFLPVGGWWAHTLLAQRVNILTKHGKVPGVIGSIPPHLLAAGSREKVMEIQNLFIDIGAESDNQASEEFGVVPGCSIVPYGPFMPMKNPKLFSAKAFDNRLGVALVIQTLLKLGKHPNTVIGAGSAQEEVGLRGARTVAQMVQPDVAIVLEGPPADDTPGTDSDAVQGKLGGGVQIRLYDPTMIPNPGYVSSSLRPRSRIKFPINLPSVNPVEQMRDRFTKSDVACPQLYWAYPHVMFIATCQSSIVTTIRQRWIYFCISFPNSTKIL